MLKEFFYKKSINQVYVVTIVFAGILTSIFTFVILSTIFNDHEEEIKELEKNYLLQQKNSVMKETNRALRYIDYKINNRKKDRDLESLKKEIVDAIEQMGRESDGSGYIFIYSFDGVNIADPILPKNKGKNLLNLRDPNGKKVIEEIIKISKQKNGGFVSYYWNKPKENYLAKKLSYSKAYTPLQWSVGSGVYLDDIEKVLEKRKRLHQKRISQFTFEILSLTVLLFLSGILIYRFFTKFIKSDVDSIRNFLQGAQGSLESKKVYDDKLTFNEFNEIALSVNEMMIEIEQKRKALEDLNKNLEIKVEEKTQKLQNSKEYAEELLLKQDKFIKTSIHEINTPLSIIITNIELFTMKNGKDPYLTKIEAGSKIINNLFNDLSYFINKDRLNYPRTSIDFSQFLRERIEFFSEIAHGAATFLKEEIEEDLKLIFNEIELQRIIDNNLSNTIKYSQKKTAIHISLQKENDFLRLDFSNNPLTPIENCEKIFDEFYRESDSRGGFGLGLKIVKDICDENSVIIKVHSDEKHTIFSYLFKKDL